MAPDPDESPDDGDFTSRWDPDNLTARTVVEAFGFLALISACVLGPTVVALAIGYWVGAFWVVPAVLLAEVLALAFGLLHHAQMWFMRNRGRNLDTEPLSLGWPFQLHAWLVFGLAASIGFLVITTILAVVLLIV